MPDREWEYKSYPNELSLIVPDQIHLEAVSTMADQMDNDFLSSVIRSQRGVTIQIKQRNFGKDVYGNDRLDDNILIVMPVEKIREMALFLLKATENLE